MAEFNPCMTSAEAQIALVQNWTACWEISRAFYIILSYIYIILSYGRTTSLNHLKFKKKLVTCGTSKNLRSATRPKKITGYI
jgi:hypothetical protein